MKSAQLETAQEADDKAGRFRDGNAILDRANEILESRRGMLPPMTWHEALRQARREAHPPKQPPRKRKLLFFL